MQQIVTHFWFDSQAEAAAEFYVSVFPGSKILSVSHYGETGQEIHGQAPGSVMTVSFELNGQQFLALNGGPLFKFNEAVSLVVYCQDQAEIDHYWSNLSAGGDPAAQQCGWLKDKFGLSWQVVPAALEGLMRDQDPAKASRTMAALLTMKKLDIAELQRAHDNA